MSSQTFPVNVTVEKGLFTFTNQNTSATVHFTKRETALRSYQIGLKFLGYSQANRPRWAVDLHGVCLHEGARTCTYSGSKEFIAEPDGEEHIKVTEIDETHSLVYWVDAKNAEIARENPNPSEKIQALIEKGRIFKVDRDQCVRNIFYSREVGVILFAKNSNGESSFYFGNEHSEDFTLCESTQKYECRCPQKDADWEITIPGETTRHLLNFAQVNYEVPNHVITPNWDKTPLKSAKLKPEQAPNMPASYNNFYTQAMR